MKSSKRKDIAPVLAFGTLRSLMHAKGHGTLPRSVTFEIEADVGGPAVVAFRRKGQDEPLLKVSAEEIAIKALKDLGFRRSD